jgi:hypothetical protein
VALEALLAQKDAWAFVSMDANGIAAPTARANILSGILGPAFAPEPS